jgi:hypothetical protein
MTVRFVSRYGIYFPRDVVAFPADEAERIVSYGVAVIEQATAPACEVSAVTVEYPQVPQDTATVGRRRCR